MTAARRQEADADLEAAIDRLYQAPLDAFTAARNALAAERRKAGDREAADRIKALPKPGLTAWAVNQAWWRDRPAFEAMLEAGRALRAAHIAHAKGKAGDVRAAAEARQRLVDAVVDRAVDALGGPGEVTPDTRHRIAGTVEALASSESWDPPPGRLSKDLHASGLEALSALANLIPASGRTPTPARPVIVSRTPPKPLPATSRADRDTRAEAAAREHAAQVADAKARLASREEALRAADAEADEHAAAEKHARASLERAAARVADLQQELDAARDAEREARRTLAQATRTASEAEMTRARTARDVKAARERLDELEKTRRE